MGKAEPLRARLSSFILTVPTAPVPSNYIDQHSLRAIDKQHTFPYNAQMSSPDPLTIRKILRHQVPEFCFPGGFLRYPGHLLIFLVSVIPVSIVGVVSMGIANLTSRRPAKFDGFYLLLGTFVAPVLFYYMGHLQRKKPERALDGKERSFSNRLTDWTVEVIYRNGKQISLGPRRNRTNESELAVSIVAHLLEHGSTSPKALTDSLIDQQVPEALVRDTLVILRKREVIEPQDEFCNLSPYWGRLFPKPDIIF